jgi:hypothetical protein
VARIAEGKGFASSIGGGAVMCQASGVFEIEFAGDGLLGALVIAVGLGVPCRVPSDPGGVGAGQQSDSFGVGAAISS